MTFRSCYIFSKKQLKTAQNGYCFTRLEYYNVSNFCGNANLPLNEEGEKRGKPISAHLLPLHLKKVQCREDSNKMHFWNTVVCILVREKNWLKWILALLLPKVQPFEKNVLGENPISGIVLMTQLTRDFPTCTYTNQIPRNH